MYNDELTSKLQQFGIDVLKNDKEHKPIERIFLELSMKWDYMKYSDITILIDMDDTIECLLESWCKWLCDKYALYVKPEDITSWNVAKYFPTLTRDQVFEPLHTDSFWKTVYPKSGAVKYVKRLIDDGFNVYICTSTDYRNVQSKYEHIIQKHFPYISWNKVIIADNKQMIDADFIIDDGPHNIVGKDWIGILFDAPHNADFHPSDSEKILRLDNWKDIYNTIVQISDTLIGG